MVDFILWSFGAALALVTLLPFRKTHAWWVRGCDFPRLHICLAASLVLILTLVLMPTGFGALAAILGAITFFQALQILPYTRLFPTELALHDGTDKPTFKILSSNVLKENKDHSSLERLITKEQPDVLFLMETDPDWIERLGPILDTYKTVQTDPRTDHYGMTFATNLDATAVNFVDLAGGDTPTVFTTLTTTNGRDFNFVGLHPRPPLPGDDTDDRDAQIRKSATIAHHLKKPVICMGDFNDVAWSRTSKIFKKIGDYRDPRIGRGLFPSFDVNHPIMRFPIDQVYVTEGIKLTHFGRGPDIGSDHFPMIISAYLGD